MAGRRRLIESERAQSETVSTLLVTLLVITTTVGVGTVLVFHLNQQIQAVEEPSEFDVDLDASNLTVTHLGGPDFSLADLELVLRQGDTERRYDLGDPGEPSDALDGDGWFEGGESISITVPHSFGGEVRILLVDTAAGGSVLYDERRSVSETTSSTPTPTPGTDTPTPTPPTAT